MALPLRTRTIPQCTACLRTCAFSETATTSSPAWRQQARGKKSSSKSPGSLPVRLLRDYPGFGKKGAVIPITAGEMRNSFFPRRIAEYVTVPELKILRANNVPIVRDYKFGQQQEVEQAAPRETESESADAAEAAAALRAKQRRAEPEKLTPARSVQLLEIFVHPVLEFYRQPIVEEQEPEPPQPESEPEPKKERQRAASSAAADLMAARTMAPLEKPKPAGPQAIYGSVSTHDILVHIRAAIATHDEAARVIVQESDIRFLDKAVSEEGRVKHVGDYTIEISVKGDEQKVKRTVRVIPQEL